MKKTLHLKFVLAYLVFGLLAFLAVSTVSSRMTYRYLIRKEADALYTEVNTLASQCSERYSGKDINMTMLRPQLNAMSSYLNAVIWIVDRQGTVTYDSSSPTEPSERTIEGFDPVDSSRNYRIGTYYGSFSDSMLSVSAPIVGKFNTYGYVIIHMPQAYILHSSNEILNIVYISFVIIFLLSLLILWVFRFAVYKPIQKITYAANEYATGNLKYNLDIRSKDELGYLAATLNYMSDELNNIGEYQKKFIANVSHDFRSPLTSIKGYIEAMLDGTIPPEMQEKYLNIVINETERLNKLTQNMLSLNALSSKGSYLDLVTFDINRVIKNTCATFEGTCQAKNITFELTFSSKTMMVYADMGKIQQVLYNLIDNAIKFSHHDSSIWIETYDKYEKVFVSVKDAGLGIPRDSLKKIWDRFYKIDSSRGKDKKGTGLGLSITKEIIQAHNENIDVISTEGVGTEFIFTLPKKPNS